MSNSKNPRIVIEELMIMTATPNSTDEMLKSTFYSGMMHKHKDNPFIDHASIKSPVHRYGKKYKKYDMEFFLFVYTKDNDAEAVEDTFTNAVKNLNREDIVRTLKGFYHLGVFHGE